MAVTVTYRAKQDCLVFGTFRSAGEIFTEAPWKKAYKWPMPDFLEEVSEAGSDDGAAPADAATQASSAVLG